MRNMLLDKFKNYEVVLASGSPRRQQLLAEMDIPFRVETKPVEETFPQDLSPEKAAAYLCRLKSRAFTDKDLKKNTLLITADTIVALENRILGKPANVKEAAEMLRQLSGRKHEVITGVCLRLQDKMKIFIHDSRNLLQKENAGVKEIMYLH